MTRVIILLSILLSAAANSFAAAPPATIAGYPVEEALRLGERMYRQGLLPSGEPMQAIVQGDIPVDGSMFTCESCHLRSGLGSVEGTIITLPTNGADLYRDYPLGTEVLQTMRKQFADEFQKEPLRPAYTDESLATALLWGLDPAGRELDQAMPRYSLEAPDLEVMIFYLKNLSSKFSPGVDEATLHFATVVTDGVPPAQRETMLNMLKAYVQDHNAQSRHQETRAQKGIFYRLEFYTAYRRIDLQIWELHGEPQTWQAQLEEYYRQKPVFALIGGLAAGEWRPIHEFCEKLRIPNLFPLTDFPVISNTDWYTLYYSKGYYQEGEAAARYLRGTDPFRPVKVLQVFRDDLPGRYLARGFEETWKLVGQPAPENRILQDREKISAPFWKELIDTYQADIVLLWLPPEDLETINALAALPGRPKNVFVSSGRLQKAVFSLPAPVRDFVSITYPYDLPQDGFRKKLALKSWLNVKKIPLTDLELQGRIFFLNRMVTASLLYVRRDYYRERFLEGLDMMIDHNYMIPVYPNLSFGPAQRYASKGCYIVQLSEGEEPTLVKKSGWVNH